MAKRDKAARSSGKKNSAVRVNFTGVETASVIPEGEYIAEVVSAKLEESEGGKNYLAWELKVAGGKYDGKKLYHNTSLQEQSLWATKRWLECTGEDVPDGEMDLDLAEYEGKQIGVVVEHDSWKGRTRSKIIDCYPAEDAGTGDDDSGDDSGDDSATVYPSPDEVNDMGKGELRALVQRLELDVELSGSTSAMRRQVNAAIEAAGEEEEDEKPKKGKKGKKPKSDDDDDEKPAKGKKSKSNDDDDEEDEKPKKGKKGKKSKQVKASVIAEADEDELAELVETHELDVDLDDIKKLTKKRAAVSEALEELGLLEDDSDED